jgi:hypothetical protein
MLADFQPMGESDPPAVSQISQSPSAPSNAPAIVQRTPSASTPKEVNTSMPPSWAQHSDSSKKLQALQACYQTEGACGFPQTDPKEEFFAIGQEIKKILLQLEHQYHDNRSRSDELNALARQFLKNPDGHVKKAALHLMASQEPNIKNLDSLLRDVIAFHDAALIPQTMLELTRYLGQGQDQRIYDALASALVRGAPFVSLAIAQQISAFLNEQSLETFVAVLPQIHGGSKTRRHLRVMIDEYEKRQSAG